MTRTYLSSTDTTALLRQALKESFPGVKFSVRQTYSGSVSIRWTDGPCTVLVESVADKFAGSYFDGMIDYRGSIFHMLDGKPVRLGLDFIHCNRSFSDAAVERAIRQVISRYAEEIEAAGVELPTVDAYQTGRLTRVNIPACGHLHDPSLRGLIANALHKHSDRLKIVASKTAGRLFVTHDDGYSRACGAGYSAVAVDQ